MTQYEKVEHVFAPVFNENSKILILGTFPSVKSRENQFFYGHPRNRFWKVLSLITGEVKPETIEDKKELLLKHGIALWDVIHSCEIIGSRDSSIKDVVPADLSLILKQTDMKQIYGNGGKAFQLYYKYSYPSTKREMIQLPSTSPANAAYSLEQLLGEWIQIKDYLE
ncbi:MAG TPA: DNA-deoxyinosine glycosylase [Candidatus Merdenecus merdavium]|nr:DNA-deoxyinosine glycosylase [Candidatus Merdenecus merdavium]